MRKRRSSYFVYIIIAFSLVLALFYESFQPRNIETVSIISGVGFEKGENKKMKMTVQIIRPEKGETGTSTSSCIVISGEGDTVTEASEEIVRKTGSALFWAHCSIILLRTDFAADQDVMPYMDMFFRSLNFRNTASVIVSEDAPGDILNSDTVFEMVSAFGIQRLLDDQDYESNSVYMSLKKFTKNYYKLSSSTVVAGVSFSELRKYTGGNSAGGSSESDKPIRLVVLSPCAVMKKGKFVSYLSQDEFNGYKWLSDTMSAKIINIKNMPLESENNQENTLGISLFGGNCRLVPMYEDGKYILKVKIDVKAQVVSIQNELQARKITPYKLENRYREYARLAEEYIKNDVNAAWTKMIETDSDYCNIQDLFYGKFSKEWQNSRPETDSAMLSGITLEYDIKVNFISGGLNKRFKLR